MVAFPPEPPPKYLNDLLQAACEGSSEALGELFERSQYYLRRLARRLRSEKLWSKMDSADLVQQTYAVALRDFAQFTGRGAGSLRCWLGSILKHLAVNEMRYLRRGKRDATRERPLDQAIAVTDPSDPSPLDRLCRGETLDAVRHVLRRLPVACRQILELRHFERKPVQLIARRLHLTEVGTRRRLENSRRRFRIVWAALQDRQDAGALNT